MHLFLLVIVLNRGGGRLFYSSSEESLQPSYSHYDEEGFQGRDRVYSLSSNSGSFVTAITSASEVVSPEQTRRANSSARSRGSSSSCSTQLPISIRGVGSAASSLSSLPSSSDEDSSSNQTNTTSSLTTLSPSTTSFVWSPSTVASARVTTTTLPELTPSQAPSDLPTLSRHHLNPSPNQEASCSTPSDILNTNRSVHVEDFGFTDPQSDVKVSYDTYPKPSAPAWVEQFDFHQDANLENVDIKAAKMDDAVIPVHLWNDRILEHDLFLHANEASEKHLDVLRSFLLIVWRRKVYLSFKKYLVKVWEPEFTAWKTGVRKLPKEFVLDINAGSLCLEYVMKADWWAWVGGSRLLFWRWTPKFQKMARDGVPVYWIPGRKPESRKLQPSIEDANVHAQMKSKLQKARGNGYIKPGKVTSLIRYFGVPKGENDIRLVYDGTASGFNDAVWTPNFGLPTIDSLIRATDGNTWMVDLDIGEMFLNFMMVEEARELVGVDITPLFPEEIKDNKHVIWERWERCGMGLKFSPYQTIRMTQVAEEFLIGNHLDEENPFHFSHVELNLPGTRSYLPGKPWFTIRRSDGSLASALAIYVDDERIHSCSYEKAWLCAHQVATREAYLGIQDAARKRRPPSQKAGAWAGSIVRTNGRDVGIMISDDRWRKAKGIIHKWFERVSQSETINLSTAELRSDRGFLVYVTRTYKSINTYLKGFHLSIDGWRDGRDEDGWRCTAAHQEIKSNDHTMYSNSSHDYPVEVKPVPRFVDDLSALMELMDFDSAPILLTHTKQIYIVKYAFGDASGAGFGSSIEGPEGLNVKYGTWNYQGSEQSSNFRELANLILTLEDEAEHGKLNGVEMFLFTDNTTAESAFHLGTSSSRSLFELILKVKKLELTYSIKLHVIHVSGKRMVEQGTDGLSRGNFIEGVMIGKSMIEFIPISQSAMERSPELLTWIRGWSSVPTLTPLTENDWMIQGQGITTKSVSNTDGVQFFQELEPLTLLWSPPPSISDVALEMLRKSIHKRPTHTHIVVIPKVMTYLWRKTILKTCDLSFYIDAGHLHWPDDMYESLFVAVYLPLLPFHPWTLRRSNSVLEVERKVRELQQRKDGSESIVLRKFLLLSRRFPTMSESMVRSLLSKGRIR